MSKKSTVPTKISVFIDARISQVRLVSERATCAPALPSKTSQKVELRTETTSGFSIGLDSPERPSGIVISIEYKASLKIPDTDKNIIEYEATHEAQFAIKGWIGFDDWTNMPSDAIAPYLAVVNNIALKKAEGTLLEMGFKGVSLPQPEFDGVLSPVEIKKVVGAKTKKAKTRLPAIAGNKV